MLGGQDQDRLRQAAHMRGTAVLADLMTRAGVSSPAELARRSELAGAAISDQTVSNLLKAKRTRDSTVLKFIAACLHDQEHNPQLVGEQAAVAFWKTRYDGALGRAGDPMAGFVRIGLPPPAPVVFVDRPDVVVLAAAVEAGESVVLTPSAEHESAQGPGRLSGERSRVLSGMGGVGKSQLAAQYARQVWQDPSLDLAIWVSARRTDTVVNAYAEAAERLLGADFGQLEQAAQRLMTWMSTTTRTWLIVLDDVQLPNQMQRWWPEPTESGQVIVTTRYRSEDLRRPGRQIIEVGLYSPQQARDYLQQRLTRAPRLYAAPDSEHPSERLLDGLATDLGHLPLALTQASAYLLQEDMSVAEYRTLFADYQNRLTTLFPHRAELPDADLDTVATTWRISMDLATRLASDKVVLHVMLVASLLDPDGIPLSVFTSEALTTFLAAALGRTVPEHELRSAVRVLHRLSLLTLDGHNLDRVVRVHALVQRATRDALHRSTELSSDFFTNIDSNSNNFSEVGSYAKFVDVTANALLELWPHHRMRGTVEPLSVQEVNNWNPHRAQVLLFNVYVLIDTARNYLWSPRVHPLLFQVGYSLIAAAPMGAYIDYFYELCEHAEQYLDADDRTMLKIRYYRYYTRGQEWQTGQMMLFAFEGLLADCTRILGSMDPDTLAVRHQWADWLCEYHYPALESGLTELRGTLSDCERVLGIDDPETVDVRRTLNRWASMGRSPQE